MAGIKVKVGADASEFERTMKSVRSQMSSLKAPIAAAGAAAAAVGVAFTAAAAGAAMLIKSASQEAIKFENLQMTFETLTGSAEKAKDMIADFRKEAQKSPLTTADYADAAKTLMGFGVSADDTLGILKQLGDVSLGNSARFEQLALAFAQTQAAGRLMGQEVLQFVNAGFNPLQQISKKTGESMLELRKRMEDGGISSKEVAEAFRSATSEGGLFFRAIEKGAVTTEGKLAALNDTVSQLKVAFGTGFNEGLKNALDAANGFLPQFQAKMTELGQSVGNAITDAVMGDTRQLEAIGVFIGTIIAEAAKATAKSLFRQFGAGVVGVGQGATNMIKNSTLFGGLIPDANIAGEASAAADVMSMRDFQIAMREATLALVKLREETATPNVSTSPMDGSRWATVGPGESSMFRDHLGRMVRSLDRIEQNTAMTPFPAN